MCKIIYSGAVRCNPLLKKVSAVDVEDAVKLWLRYACDREGGRRRREVVRDRNHSRSLTSVSQNANRLKKSRILRVQTSSDSDKD